MEGRYAIDGSPLPGTSLNIAGVTAENAVELNQTNKSENQKMIYLYIEKAGAEYSDLFTTTSLLNEE
jgi:hypothetical protein